MSTTTPALSASPEPPRRPWWMARRVALAAVGIVLLAGATTYVVALNEVGKVVAALGETRPVKVAPSVLAPTSKGAPETLLLIGNDERPPPKGNPDGAVLPHSNEMLLVRIDPSKPTISMLPIPRELQVTFTAPNGEVITNRINSAYTYGFEDGGGASGGVKLMIKTIKSVLGIPVINHVFVTNFKRFGHAVNEMGCVYTTVDKRYHHVNEPGGEQYFEINLQPGYQRLCGKQALEFVANRHESTSLIRDARDQRFLLEVKAQYGPALFEDREEFERIFGKAVETDLHGGSQVLDLLELLVESTGKPVRQVPFHVTLLPSVDTATPEQLRETTQTFLGGTAAIPKQKLDHEVSSARRRSRAHDDAPGLSLTPTTGGELMQARSEAPQLRFPLEYPRVRNAFAGAEPDMLRLYDIHDAQGNSHPSYVIVIDQGLLGQFYDIQGTTWTNPPLLSNPNQMLHIGSRSYSLFYTGEQIRTIAWHEHGGEYWIENTLTNNVAPREMLAMAEQTVPVISPRGAHVTPGPPTQRGFNLPPREPAATALSSSLAAGVGFVSLGILALLAVLVCSRQRELILLREQVATALRLEARRRTLLAAGASVQRPERASSGKPIRRPWRGGIFARASKAPTRATAVERRQRPLSAADVAITGTGEPATTIYRAENGRRRAIRAGGGIAIAAVLIALLAYLLRAEVLASSRPSNPSVPVAVLNATSTPGAARGLAEKLRTRVQLGEIGDITADLGSGVYVFYPSGARAEALRVARLIPGLTPKVASIEPQVQSAIGKHKEIVVIVD
ncbi:MAG TPA: LCP family protein [Solirubrobacteraceae bacterium]|nr:LCP family protein [Solirubrobacteraceae bacterium]